MPEPLTSPYFPFHALGYRCNPFRVLTDEEWMEVAVLPPRVEAALREGPPHLQILGEAGRGKSTSLLALEGRFRREGLRVAREYLPLGERRYRTDLGGLDLFLLDEAQRLTPRERNRLIGAASGGLRLVLGSHEDLEPLFRRRGLRVATVRLDKGEAEHFRTVFRKRLDYFALDNEGGPRMELREEDLNALRGRFGTDLRGAERALYEWFQAAVELGSLPGGDP